MPTYDYECGSCGLRFERFQSMTEKPLKKCPACGKSVRRLIGTGIGILMKGASTGGSGSSCSLDGTCPTCCGPDQR